MMFQALSANWERWLAEWSLLGKKPKYVRHLCGRYWVRNFVIHSAKLSELRRNLQDKRVNTWHAELFDYTTEYNET
jgi:hypothetical protein